MRRTALAPWIVLVAFVAITVPVSAGGGGPPQAVPATGELHYLPCQSSSDQAHPAISGHQVVYQQFEQDHWDVYLCDITERSALLLTAASHATSEMHPRIHLGVVTWETYGLDGTFLGLGVYHDSGLRWAIDAHLPMNATEADLWDSHWNETLTDGMVAWEWNTEDQWDIFVQDREQDLWLQVTDSRSDQRHPAMDGKIVVFEDHSSSRSLIQYFVIQERGDEPAIRMVSPLVFIVAASAAGGALVVGAHLGLRRSWWYVSLLTPLYSRLNRHQLLENEKREQVYSHIRHNPGLHFRGIMADLGISNGALVYHLQTLQREGYIKSRREGRYRRYFPTLSAPVAFQIDVEGKEVKQVTALLTPAQTKLMDKVRESPGMHQTELAQFLGVSRQTLHYNLGVLKKQELVVTKRDGRVVRVHPA